MVEEREYNHREYTLAAGRKLLKAIEQVCRQCSTQLKSPSREALPGASDLCPNCNKVRALIDAYHSISQDMPHINLTGTEHEDR